MKKEKLEKLVEMIKDDLRNKLNREPTEKEIVEKLPLFLCNCGCDENKK